MLALALALALGPAAARAQAIHTRDDAGRDITLPAPARRVVSLAPHATELLYAAGAGRAIVGVDRDSNYPSEALKLPRVGNGLQPNAERIVALAPDLVVLWAYGDGLAHAGLPDSLLERLGIRLYYSNPRKLADIPDAIERLGELTGTRAAAGAHAANLRRRLAALATRYAGQRPVRVFYQVGSQPMYTVNDRGIIGDALRTCGAVNVFGGLSAAAPMVGAESVLRENPQAIIVGQAGPGADAALAAWKDLGPALAAVPDNLWAVDPDAMHRPGPRMIEATERLCERVDATRRRAAGR
ncbi:cobalamin-binding protein [Pigmentiphaga sp. H8]|uniref:cobalamin-binding protein n=1 Tax=Pigmentiphaga sp. H8 TaxID=2488560 RepID=UPI001EDF175D|nr:cobalamin-binding protein [Pigmentiphaga sp. H8]